jgi:hypothetical protein
LNPRSGSNFSTVTADNQEGGFLAGEYLVKLGHRRIGVVSSVLRPFALEERMRGVHAALSERGLELDSALIALGAAQFEFDATQPLQPWRVHTDDGRLDLRFTPEGARQADIDLGVVASHYVQPVGTFEGWVRAAPADPPRPVQGLLGVTEDHRSAW